MFTDHIKIVVPLLLVCTSSVQSFRRHQRSVAFSHSTRDSHRQGGDHQYVIKKFTVPINHFAFASAKTFEMRYLVNGTWQCGENAPIFFYTGNEDDIESYVETSAFMYDLAPAFKALIVFAEHRYYGKSLPFGDKSLTNKKYLNYLSSQQALADYVDLIDFLRSHPSMERSPVIVFGGSYGGMLSAWMRMKYPHVVQGAIASSAPVLYFHGASDCHGYYRTLTSVFREADDNCPAVIRRSWSAIDDITSTEEGRAWLSTAWNLCDNITDEIDATWLKAWLQTGYSSLAISNDPYATLSLPANPVNEFCEYLKNTTKSSIDILTSLKQAVMLFPSYQTDNCIDTKEDMPNLIAWRWQGCTEMVSCLCADGIEDMFEPSPWDFEEYTRDCQDEFDVTPQLDLACKIYGCSDFSGASNIVFSNGLLDPWHTGGILKNVSESVIAVIIPEGDHQLDLAASNPGDPKSVTAARNVHRYFISKWIRDYSEVHEPED